MNIEEMPSQYKRTVDRNIYHINQLVTNFKWLVIIVLHNMGCFCPLPLGPTWHSHWVCVITLIARPYKPPPSSNICLGQNLLFGSWSSPKGECQRDQTFLVPATRLNSSMPHTHYKMTPCQIWWGDSDKYLI